jgi:hypothetical protein
VHAGRIGSAATFLKAGRLHLSSDRSLSSTYPTSTLLRIHVPKQLVSSCCVLPVFFSLVVLDLPLLSRLSGVLPFLIHPILYLCLHLHGHSLTLSSRSASSSLFGA